MIVALAAFIEGLVIINVYLPGSAVVLLAVVMSRGDPTRAAVVVLTAAAALVAASQVNYGLGRFGLYPTVARLGGRRWLAELAVWYDRHGALVLLPGYVHPSVGGLLSVLCGVGRLRWSRFAPLATLGILFWASLWGLAAYTFSGSVRRIATTPTAVLAGLILWAIVAVLWEVGYNGDNGAKPREHIE